MQYPPIQRWGEIQNVVTGVESGMRDNISFYLDDCGVIGREFYRFSTSDPRFTSDLLGKGTAVLDNNTFYLTNPFAARYRAIKNLNILIAGLTNTTTAGVTAEKRLVGKAYANTVKAHEFLMVLNLEYDNGIRIDVADPNGLGPFLTRQQSLDTIANLLNTAYTVLTANASTTFPFNSTLFGNTAGEFAKFNRALAARVAVYRSDWAGAITALNNSFFSLNGSFNTGSLLPVFIGRWRPVEPNVFSAKLQR